MRDHLTITRTLAAAIRARNSACCKDDRDLRCDPEEEAALEKDVSDDDTRE